MLLGRGNRKRQSESECVALERMRLVYLLQAIASIYGDAVRAGGAAGTWPSAAVAAPTASTLQMALRLRHATQHYTRCVTQRAGPTPALALRRCVPSPRSRPAPVVFNSLTITRPTDRRACDGKRPPRILRVHPGRVGAGGAGGRRGARRRAARAAVARSEAGGACRLGPRCILHTALATLCRSHE
ncbi:hypothetical protein EVAR_99324_1 [Eumeta japonica]|uniref:Uncharacterized protein n=1 Tax=Eumeta variegata TaxID=151549 RepID=A0A4C1ZM65_EUMVA|nr:hypothetical protein EVAR_99324_1 [Eumeta japonica]